jgi:hypothetical protein
MRGRVFRDAAGACKTADSKIARSINRAPQNADFIFIAVSDRHELNRSGSIFIGFDLAQDAYLFTGAGDRSARTPRRSLQCIHESRGASAADHLGEARLIVLATNDAIGARTAVTIGSAIMARCVF